MAEQPVAPGPSRPLVAPPRGHGARMLRAAPPLAVPRQLTPGQLAAIRTAMQLFVEDDEAHAIAPHGRLLCAGCDRPRPQPGFVHYARYALCNACATEYEVARARALVASVGQFVRDKRFGEAERYALPPAPGRSAADQQRAAGAPPAPP